MSSAVKLSDELVVSARREAKIASRSMTQQIEHWARIGRVIERAGGADSKRLRAALAAELEFDALTNEEQAIVLGELEAAVFRPQGDNDVARFVRGQTGHKSELGAQGEIVSLAPNGRRETVADVDGYANARRAEARRR